MPKFKGAGETMQMLKLEMLRLLATDTWLEVETDSSAADSTTVTIVVAKRKKTEDPK